MNTSLLNKATSSDSSPTPGYLFEEIAKMTLISYEVNLKIIQWLALRLNNRSANVKWKVLLVCRHVAIKGSPQFKIGMMREHLGVIKQHLQFGGPQDPLRGDEANQRVRDAAANAIEALSSDNSGSQVGASRMVGMGSDSMNQQQQPPQQQQQSNSYSGSGAGYVNNTGKMQGIGSEPWDPNQKKTSMSSAAFNAARSVASKVVYTSGSAEQMAMARPSNGDVSHTYASNRGSNPHSNGAQWKPTPGFSSGGGVNNSGNNNASWSDGPRTNKGVGGVWGTQGGNNVGSNQAGQANHQPSQMPGGGGGSGSTGGGNADGTYERQLIVDLCAPGGTRAVPPQEELNRFIKIAPSLSPDLVGPNILEQFLADGTWQSKNKALTVATSLVQAPGCNIHVEWLAANAIDDLTVLAESCTKPQVCTKARALIALLNGEEAPVPSPVTRAQPPTSSYVPSAPVQVEASEIDLLGGFSDEASSPEPIPQPQAPPSPNQPPQAPTPAQAPVGGSLFGNLTVNKIQSPAVVPPTQVTAAAHLTVAQPQSNGDMFGNLSINAPPPPPSQPVQSQPPQMMPTVVPVDDPFGFADLSNPVAPAQVSYMPQQNMNQPQQTYHQQMGQPHQMGYMPQQQNMNGQMQMSPQQMGQFAQQPYPMQNQPMQMNQMGQPMNQAQYQQMMMQMNQMNMNGQVQRVPMSQGMMSPVRSANMSIPDMNAMQSMNNGSKIGSGFDFMGSANRARGPSADQKDDAFSFVRDSMKAKS